MTEITRAFPLCRISVQEKVNRFVAAGIVKKGPRLGKGIPLTATGKPINPSRRERIMLGKRAWTKEEDFLLECMAESMPIDLLIKKWPGNLLKCERKDSELHWPCRTKDAIRNRCRSIGVSLKPVTGLIPMQEMSRQLGIDHSTLASWVRLGRLKATIYPSRNPKRRRVFLTYKNLLDFFTDYPRSLEYYQSKGLDIEDIKELANEAK